MISFICCNWFPNSIFNVWFQLSDFVMIPFKSSWSKSAFCLGESKSIYVRNLHSGVYSLEVMEEFKNFGRIKQDGVFVNNRKVDFNFFNNLLCASVLSFPNLKLLAVAGNWCLLCLCWVWRCPECPKCSEGSSLSSFFSPIILSFTICQVISRPLEL